LPLAFDQRVQTGVHILHDDMQDALPFLHFEEVVLHFYDIGMV